MECRPLAPHIRFGTLPSLTIAAELATRETFWPRRFFFPPPLARSPWRRYRFGSTCRSLPREHLPSTRGRIALDATQDLQAHARLHRADTLHPPHRRSRRKRVRMEGRSRDRLQSSLEGLALGLAWPRLPVAAAGRPCTGASAFALHVVRGLQWMLPSTGHCPSQPYRRPCVQSARARV